MNKTLKNNFLIFTSYHLCVIINLERRKYMEKYIIIHNTITNTEEFIIKSFNALEECNSYIITIQDVIDDNSLFTFYKKLDNNSYYMYNDMYCLTHGIKSITLNN